MFCVTFLDVVNDYIPSVDLALVACLLTLMKYAINIANHYVILYRTLAPKYQKAIKRLSGGGATLVVAS